MERQASEEGSYKRLNKIDNLQSVLDSDILESLQQKYKVSNNLEKLNDARAEVGFYFRDLELRDGLLQNKSILDLGSANHFFDEYCEQKYGSRVVAVDIEQEELGVNHPQGIVTDARSLPFKDDSFDLVISHASMPHILVPQQKRGKWLTKIDGETREKTLEDVLDVFRESYRTLKVGG
ncbi:MAG: Methyltransferase domain [Candidatus Parcubacteria bacterium]|jgi:hypothetical protein